MPSRRGGWRGRTPWAAVLLAGLLSAVGCGGAGTTRPAADSGGGVVSVLYAGALVNVMERGIAPAFDRATGYRFEGFAGGAVELANQIRGRLRRADVFVSAVPDVNRSLAGQANGDWVRWYVRFAEAPLVIAYNPKSPFAAALKAEPWYRVMAQPGFRLGRTDPGLDPKGALTVRFVRDAERFYGEPGLSRRLLGDDRNPAQVFPEETLLGRLQSGQLDAGFFYANEAVQAGLPYITPPAAIDPRAAFTATVVRGAPNPEGAVAFVRFLLGSQAREIMERDGLTVVGPTLEGDAAAVPAGLQALLR